MFPFSHFADTMDATKVATHPTGRRGISRRITGNFKFSPGRTSSYILRKESGISEESTQNGGWSQVLKLLSIALRNTILRFEISYSTVRQRVRNIKKKKKKKGNSLL